MKYQLSYIDGRFYKKSYEGQGIIILFQKPNSASEQKCESISNLIYNTFKQKNYSLTITSTELIDEANLGNESEIKETLFVFVEDKGQIIASGLKPIFGIRTIELKSCNKDKTIARIEKTKPHGIGLYILPTIIVFAICGLLLLVSHIKENSRKENNHILYSADVAQIKLLSDTYSSSILCDSTYVDYITSSAAKAVENYIVEMSHLADSRYKSVQESGEYVRVNLNEDSVISQINTIVLNAKSEENKEVWRKNKNRAAYQLDIDRIKRLRIYLTNAIILNDLSTTGYNQPSISELRSELNSYDSEAEANFNEVTSSGLYKNVNIDTLSFKSRVDYAIDNAKRKLAESKIKRKNNTTTTHNSSQNSDESKYNQYVNKGDIDYKKFYKSGKTDKAAARQAISNYKKALLIKKNSQVQTRMEYLQQAIN